MYQVRKIDVAVVITGIALLLPLTFSWAAYLGPLLAVFGTIAICGLVIVRTSQSLMQANLPEQRTRVSSVSSHRERIMQATPRIAGAALPPPPKGGITEWIQNQFGGVWNSKRHGLILVCAALWVVFPLDGDFIPVLGWVDDGFAAVLGLKHLAEMFQRDVKSAHTSMVGAIERARERDALPDDNVIDANSVRERV